MDFNEYLWRNKEAGFSPEFGYNYAVLLYNQGRIRQGLEPEDIPPYQPPTPPRPTYIYRPSALERAYKPVR